MSPAELFLIGEPVDLERLMKFGGFLEPFLSNDPIDSDRWRMQYVNGLIRTDVLDFEKIHDFKSIELVLELLKLRVGAPVSFTSVMRVIPIKIGITGSI